MAVQSQAKDSNAVKELLALLPERKIYNQNDPIGGKKHPARSILFADQYWATYQKTLKHQDLPEAPDEPRAHHWLEIVPPAQPIRVTRSGLLLLSRHRRSAKDRQPRTRDRLNHQTPKALRDAIVLSATN
jgi:hypothetical protein